MSNNLEVISFVADPKPKDEGFVFTVKDLVQQGDEDINIITETTPKKRGPGRPSKNSDANSYTDIVVADHGKKEKSLEKQYEKGYFDNAKMLYGAIAQTEQVYQDINEELIKFRTNKAYGGRNRIDAMSNYMNTQVSLINTKITAVRELNNIRSKINDLVMKKEQQLKDTGDDNSDKAIMDAYYALVNAQRYGLPPIQRPLDNTSINTGINLRGTPIQSTGIITAGTNQDNADNSFQEYQNNLDPTKKRMIADKDPNIKTVVVYDQNSGNKYFDVINVSTGTTVPGVERPGEFLLDNMRVDINNGIAVNSNTNMTFPLVIIGTRASDEL